MSLDLQTDKKTGISCLHKLLDLRHHLLVKILTRGFCQITSLIELNHGKRFPSFLFWSNPSHNFLDRATCGLAF